MPSSARPKHIQSKQRSTLRSRASLERLEGRRLLASQAEFMPTYLVSDQANHALVQDPNLVAPWGIGLSPTGDFSISDHGTGTVAQYGGDVNGSPLVPSPQAISVPGGSTTGQTGVSAMQFTLTGGSSPVFADYLFASDSGEISGWNATSSANSAQSVAMAANADFTGLAAGQMSPQGPVVYAADFHNNRIDVFNSAFQAVPTQGLFTDPNLPAGWAPYNIANLNGELFVAYALQDASRLHPVTGQSNGIIDVYTQDGLLQNRLVTSAGGTPGAYLDAPWGMAIAPNTFGGYGGDLLVANTGNGQIDAFSLSNMLSTENSSVARYVGTLLSATAQPLTIDGLRGLIVGNDNSSGSSSTVYFTAGPNNGTHGLFGAISSLNNSGGAFGNPLVADGLEFPVTFGTNFSGSVATFSDVIGTGVQSFATTINWGDGTASPGTVVQIGANQYLVQGSHAYSATGAYQIKVAIADVQSNAVSVQSVAIVTPGSGSGLTLTGTNVSYTPGTAFNGEVASFMDGDGNVSSNAYTASINWGDGTTSTGTINKNGNGFEVAGTHTYTRAGTFDIVSTVNDTDGTVATATATAAVAGSDELTATAARPSPTQGTSFSGPMAYFSDTNPSSPANDFMATINWGDGATSTGSITGSAGKFTVTGTHTYSQLGTEAAVVSISQSPPGTATATANVPLTVVASSGGGGGNSGGGTGGGGGSGGGGGFGGGVGAGGNFQGWINALFEDLLGRAPGLNDMAYFSHLAIFGQKQQVVSDIVNSPEFQSDQVNSLYQQYLHRAADPAGLAYFTSLLANGATTSDVAASLAASPEFYASQAGGTDADFLNALFQDALGRPIDAAAEQYFLAALASGQSRQQVAATVLSSNEHLSDVVNGLYQRLLNRPADPSGLQYWTSQLQAAGIDQVMSGIATSNEFYNGIA